MPVEGGQRLRRLLNRMPDEITRQVKIELKQAAELTQYEMQKRVPVNDGDLFRSIEIWESKKDGMVYVVGPGAATRRAKRLAGWRARFIEFGTRPHSLTKASKLRGRTRKQQDERRAAGRQHPGAAPRPFIHPAFAVAKVIFRPRINAAVSRALRAAIRSG